MGDLAVETAELAHVRARLEDLAALLAAAGARVAAGDALALGATRMVLALERAQDDWQVHVASLRLLAHVAARDLGSAAAAYEDCEAGAQRLLAGAAGAVAATGDDVAGPRSLLAAGSAAPAAPAAPAPVLGPPVPLGPPPLGPPDLVAGR